MAGILSAIGGAVASNVGNAWNIFQTLKGWQRDDWNTQRMFDREDTAVQRRVADLKAAGLSPVLAAGSAASTGTPIANSHQTSLENPVGAYLSTVQQRSEIDHTNAQTELTNQQVTSEGFRQSLMNGQIKEIDERIKNLSSERQGIDLRNSWINADMSSKIGLRDGQLEHLAKDTIRIGQQTELLKAQTAYEQTAMDKLLTDIDNAKILRDMNNFDLTTRGIKLYNDTYAINKGLIGKIFGDIRQPFSGLDIRHAIKNVDSSWYWENRK